MIKRFLRKGVWVLLLVSSATATAQQVPTPKSHFGFAIGDNYHLTNYTQTEAYFKKLAASSNRVKLVDIGKTEEGRSQYMLIITSLENHKNLDKYKAISQKLAKAENLTDQQAKELAQQGKPVVWIDGGLHATENVGAHQLIETAYQLISRTDAETNRLLDNVIVLMTHANPDGHELQGNWYMRNPVPEKRRATPLPRLYEKYAGHDNNRDFFMLNLKETQNIAKQLFIEWNPQIMYNHHQSGPAGTVLAGPPYRDPHNFVFDPVILTSLDAVGAAMHNRLNVEGKPGYTQRNGSVFSTWYNGGLRTVTYFHNMVGLLTEIVGGPNPSEIPLVPRRLLPNSDSANPVTPRKWYFKDAIDYSVSLNYAVLNYAQRYGDEVLYNMYRMGKNSIEKGSKDTWSLAPKKIEAINNAAIDGGADLSQRSIDKKYFDKVMKNPELRDARGYIIPADQADLPTAVKFLNALIKTGVVVQQSSTDFTVEGKKYPAGSYVVKTDQAYRPHILDMFEPQDHPHDFKYPGGPPVAPYDAAGWTPAYTMNVKFDRVLNAFDGPFNKLPFGKPISVAKPSIANGGVILSAQSNESFIAVNDLLKAGVEVFRNTENGEFFIADGAKVKEVIAKGKFEFGLNAKAGSKPKNSIKLKPSRIALLDNYGGAMVSGWCRLILENYRYPFAVVYPPDIDAGKLKDYDVLIVLSSVGNIGSSKDARNEAPESIPAEYKGIYGEITKDISVPQIKDFVEKGGKIVTIGNGTKLINNFKIPVSDAMVVEVDGKAKKLGSDKYYIPGSVLSVKVDQSLQSNWGLDENTAIYFDADAVYKIKDKSKVKPLAWFATDKPLLSGWALGQEYLKDGVTAFETEVGKGKLVVFGPNITFRSQTHGTFKWLFNQLYK